MSHLGKWFTDRWPWYPVKHLLLHEEIPGGASYFTTLGTAVGVIFALQIVSGVIQLFYYVPSIDHAYDSVSYLRTQVPFGWFVHAMHYWGANGMVFLVGLHMIRVYVWGGYKHELTWLIGVALVLLTMAMSFTGAPLIWDQAGYWAGEVGSSITSTVPFAGDFIKTLLRGGESMGPLALSRFFILHVGILAPVLAVLIGAHVIAFRYVGVVGPWDERKRRMTGPFWPDQAYKDAIVSTAFLFGLIALSVFTPPAFTGPADPTNTTYVPKSEWNFLFLYQVLKGFKGAWEPVGTVGVPLFLILLLIALPFIDRSSERNPRRRPVAIICLVLYAGAVAVYTVLGYLSPGVQQMPRAKQQQPVPSPRALSPEAKQGEQLFDSQGCTGCHMVNGKGGSTGPDLSSEGTKGHDRKWLADQIRNPKSHNPASIMPSFSKLSDRDVNNLVDYLLSLGGGSPAAGSSGPGQQTPVSGQQAGGAGSDPPPSRADPEKTDQPAAIRNLPGPAAYVTGDAVNGAILYVQMCTSCHGPDGRDNIPNPGSSEGKVPGLNPVDRKLFSSDPVAFAENIDKVIQHGSTPEGKHPALKMPDWGDSHSMSQEEISNIEAYIMKLNGIDRAQIMHPGMEPGKFFILVAAVYAAMIVALVWIKNRKKYAGR